MLRKNSFQCETCEASTPVLVLGRVEDAFAAHEREVVAELDPAVAPLHHRLHLAALHHDPLPLSDRLASPLDRLRFDPPAWIMSCNGLLGAPKWTEKHSKAGPRQNQVEHFFSRKQFHQITYKPFWGAQYIPAGIVDQDGPESDLHGVHGGGVHADVGGDPRHVAVRHSVAPQVLL